MASTNGPSSPGKKPQGATAKARKKGSAASSDRNWGAIATVAAVVVIGGGIVAAAVISNSGKAASTSLSGVATYTNAGGKHTAGYFDPVTYPQSPPVGGKHNPIWENCGVYSAPIRNENAVHTLEHGAVWITYKPDLPVAQIKTLADDYAAGQDYMLMSPYAAQTSPIVLTAWDRQLKVDSPTDPRIKSFITAYRNGKTTPERGASCDNGVGTPTDRTVTDNTKAIKAAASASPSPAPSESASK